MPMQFPEVTLVWSFSPVPDGVMPMSQLVTELRATSPLV